MDKEAFKELKSFLNSIDIEGEKAILFGSKARGYHLKSSDAYDILISNNFKCVDWTERGKRLYLAWESDYPVEILCYTPEEFDKKKKQIGTVRKAVGEGIET